MRSIICIVGKSGAGKTALAKYLDECAGIPSIVSYTTRPMRDGETDGVEHIFVDNARVPETDMMLAHTFFGGYHYWTEFSQVDGMLLDNDAIVYVIDERGVNMLKDVIKSRKMDIRIIPVYVDRMDLGDIDPERVGRDKDRIGDDDMRYQYDAVIHNNGSLDELFASGEKTIKELLEKQ